MALAEELTAVGMSPMAAIAIPNGNVAAVTATTSSTTLTATVLKAGINRVTGADGVKLPAMNPGSSVMVINDTGSSIKVWPTAGGAIQVPGTSFGSAGVDTAYSHTTYATVVYTCIIGGTSALFSVQKSA